jgi:hypothetical protein
MSCYSIDLRVRVIEAIKSGYSQTKASRLFKVCRKTIYSWLKLDSQGDLSPITGFQKGHSHGIKDLSKLRAFVDLHPDYTQEEIGHHFGVSGPTISRGLKKLKYSRKKKPNLFRKR